MANTHGSGEVDLEALAHCGTAVVFEPGSMVFHPENIEIGDEVYIGHYAILKGYHDGKMTIGAGTWVGQQAFLHSAGDLHIGQRVGIGPGVRILTSAHQLLPGTSPIMNAPVERAAVVLEDGCDIGTSAVILPGVRVGRGAQIGAGAVVSENVPPGAIAAGVPAVVIRQR